MKKLILIAAIALASAGIMSAQKCEKQKTCCSQKTEQCTQHKQKTCCKMKEKGDTACLKVKKECCKTRLQADTTCRKVKSNCCKKKK